MSKCEDGIIGGELRKEFDGIGDSGLLSLLILKKEKNRKENWNHSNRIIDILSANHSV